MCVDLLKDKTALVTGSSGGIGAAIAKLFARQCAKVVVHGRDGAALSAVRGEIEHAGGRAMHLVADMTKFSDIEAMRCQIEQELGPIDILVANAGGSFTKPGPLEETSEEGWRGVTLREPHGHVPDDQELSARHEGAQSRQNHHDLFGGSPPAA